MSPIRMIIYAVLVLSGVAFSAFAIGRERRRIAEDRARPPGRPTGKELGVGFITDFFDTLGIGSFAPTTALYRALKIIPDELIPGTLMVGHMIPTIAQAVIYITVIEVDPLTLALLLAAAAAGAWLGGGVVAKLDRRRVQLGMGCALMLAATIMLAGLLGLLPPGRDLIALHGGKLVAGIVGNFVLGALMNIGIGAYAPSLIMFGLLGMNVKSIFPIMMGSCAVIMPAGGVQFVRAGSYSPRAALGLTLGGFVGVLIAAFVVRELPLAVVKWMVVAVVLITASSLLRAGLRAPASTPSMPAA